MTEVRFWLANWEHQCCGESRKVGDVITAPVCCDGSTVELTAEPRSTEARPDGSMMLVGEVSDFNHAQPAWVIDTGCVKVAWRGKYPGVRVRCSGKLWEERHGPDSYSMPLTGRLTGIRWHKAAYEPDGEGRVVGYERETVIYNTNKYPGYPPPPRPVPTRSAVSTGKGWIRYKGAPMDDYEPSGWAFEFILEVPEA